MLRRKTILNGVKALVLAAFFCLFYGFFIEPKTLAVRHFTIKSAAWQGEPLKIAFIADIHIGGKHVNVRRVQDIVARISEQNPDIVLMAGDYVDGHDKFNDRSAVFNTEIQNGISAFLDLKAPLGVHAVLGNHDAWYGNNVLAPWLEQSNVRLMDNQIWQFEHHGNDICLVGLADEWTGQEDKTVFAKCGAVKNKLVIMHSPDSFHLVPTDFSLMLAGHTHGGQINIPLIGRRITSTKLGKKYAYGRGDYSGIPVFVTAGIGTSVMPARFRAPPEIVIITLRAP